MAELPTDALRTRLSLLDRVKNLDDHASWKEFFVTYERLVRGLARRRGLGDHEAARQLPLEVVFRREPALEAVGVTALEVEDLHIPRIMAATAISKHPPGCSAATARPPASWNRAPHRRGTSPKAPAASP